MSQRKPQAKAKPGWPVASEAKTETAVPCRTLNLDTSYRSEAASKPEPEVHESTITVTEAKKRAADAVAFAHADAVADAYKAAHAAGFAEYFGTPKFQERLAGQLAKATATENEACGKVADHSWFGTAKKIRARMAKAVAKT